MHCSCLSFFQVHRTIRQSSRFQQFVTPSTFFFWRSVTNFAEMRNLNPSKFRRTFCRCVVEFHTNLWIKEMHQIVLKCSGNSGKVLQISTDSVWNVAEKFIRRYIKNSPSHHFWWRFRSSRRRREPRCIPKHPRRCTFPPGSRCRKHASHPLRICAT